RRYSPLAVPRRNHPPKEILMLRTMLMSRAVVPLLLAVAALAAPARVLAGAPTSRPVGSVVITGALEDRVLLTVDQFKPLPLTLQTLTVKFQAGSAQEEHTFTGFLLYDVLNFLGPQFDPNVKNDRLRFYVSATGTDDYQAIVAWGEFDPFFGAKS